MRGKTCRARHRAHVRGRIARRRVARDLTAPSSSGSSVVVVLGGETRHRHVGAAGSATRPLVLLQNRAGIGASCLRVLPEAAQGTGRGGLRAASRRDSVALEDGGFLAAALPRDRVVQLQTPQAFRRDSLAHVFRLLHGQALKQTTSVPPLLLEAGYRVRLVPGSPDNIKITFPEDWEIVRAKLASNFGGIR